LACSSLLLQWHRHLPSLAAWLRAGPAEALNLIASAVSFASAMPLPFLIDGQQLLFWNDYIIMDRMSAWVILCTSIVYFLASIYAVGYMRLLNEDKRLCWFYALFAGFGLTTLITPRGEGIGVERAENDVAHPPGDDTPRH
jgi:hydrogenase-4 component F